MLLGPTNTDIGLSSTWASAMGPKLETVRSRDFVPFELATAEPPMAAKLSHCEVILANEGLRHDVGYQDCSLSSPAECPKVSNGRSGSADRFSGLVPSLHRVTAW